MADPVPDTTTAPPVDAEDAAWVSIPAPMGVQELADVCRDLEALFRVNPYYYFRVWAQTGEGTYHAEFQNQSNDLDYTLDMEVTPGPGAGFVVHYSQGIKKRTVFTIEPFQPAGAGKGPASRLTLIDDYSGLPAEERNARLPEVDKSLKAWGEALRVYFQRLKRWSWLPGWRWYIRRVWVPMKPSARRIVWFLYLITVAEFFFFLFVLMIYVIEQR